MVFESCYRPGRVFNGLRRRSKSAIQHFTSYSHPANASEPDRSTPIITQLVLKMQFSTIIISTALFLVSGSHAWTDGVANNVFYNIGGSK